MSQGVKERAAVMSMLASGGIASAKLVVALLTGSLALLTDALHSLMDVAATVMTWFAVRLSAKPADDQHHYGHGKVESISALVEVGLLVAVSAYAFVEAGARLLGRSDPEVGFSWLAIAVLVLAIIVDFVRARSLEAVAAQTSSQALASNALHFSADMWQSAVVLAGLAFVWLGFPEGDAVAALAIAVFIVSAAWKLGKRSYDTLVDTAPAGVAEAIREAAADVRGIVSVERVRVRTDGAVTFAEVGVAVRRTLAPERAVAVKAKLAEAIAERLPGIEATITAEPVALSDESVLERVLLIAAARRVPVHHVTVQQIEDRLAVSLDLEVDGRMSLEAAHVIASRLEASIREEFGPDTEVETHIEPLEAHDLPGRDVPEAERAAIAAQIKEMCREYDILGDVHDVRVRETEKGRVVALHCLADGKTAVADVHEAVDTFEREIRARCAGVARVVTHAEPRRADAPV